MHPLVWAKRMCDRVTRSDLLSDLAQPDSIQTRHGSSKKLTHKFFAKPKGFEYLRAGIRSNS
jgi:hypothetical protein